MCRIGTQETHVTGTNYTRFARETRGNVAMIFALITIPILLVGAFAIDSSRHLSSNQHLQSAIDAASLAGARALEDATKSDTDIEAIAQGAYRANLLGTHGDVTCLDSHGHREPRLRYRNGRRIMQDTDPARRIADAR